MREHCHIANRFEAIIVDEEADGAADAGYGAAMAITPGMRSKLEKNRQSVRGETNNSSDSDADAALPA